MIKNDPAEMFQAFKSTLLEEVEEFELTPDTVAEWMVKAFDFGMCIASHNAACILEETIDGWKSKLTDQMDKHIKNDFGIN